MRRSALFTVMVKAADKAGRQLLRDFGASPWQKTGLLAPLKELIVPYVPRDYATVVSRAPTHSREQNN